MSSAGSCQAHWGSRPRVGHIRGYARIKDVLEKGRVEQNNSMESRKKRKRREAGEGEAGSEEAARACLDPAAGPLVKLPEPVLDY